MRHREFRPALRDLIQQLGFGPGAVPDKGRNTWVHDHLWPIAVAVSCRRLVNAGVTRRQVRYMPSATTEELSYRSVVRPRYGQVSCPCGATDGCHHLARLLADLLREAEGPQPIEGDKLSEGLHRARNAGLPAHHTQGPRRGQFMADADLFNRTNTEA